MQVKIKLGFSLLVATLWFKILYALVYPLICKCEDMKKYSLSGESIKELMVDVFKDRQTWSLVVFLILFLTSTSNFICGKRY
jgi:hypothetical protein